MRTALARPLFLLALASCKSDGGVKVYNTPPGVSFVAPADGSTTNEGAAVAFDAVVDDAQDSPDALLLTWTSDLDGVLLADDHADADGRASFTTANLLPGTHVIELTATDSSAASGSDALTLEVVGQPDAPSIEILSPGRTDEAWEGVPFPLEAIVSDPQDPPESLIVEITSDLDGLLCEPVPGADGLVACDVVLSVGDHLLTFSALDSDGMLVEATADLEVIPGALTDDDLDGYTESEGDCNDGEPAVHPGAAELPNGVDDDCDGVTDEGTNLYDDDGDGFTEGAGDCDDADATAYPDAVEACDGVDDDCDGITDEGTNCFDDDGDSFTELDGDCDDAEVTIYPGAFESPDGVDEDCDGTADEGTSAYDDDGDCACEVGPCTGSANAACGALIAGDCQDGNALVGPLAVELCDGIDNDCDLALDEEDAADARDWFADVDLDSFGDPAVSVAACAAPAGFVSNDDDCDDGSAGVRPTASEVCNTIDDDCDGSADEGVLLTFWFDADTDGYGNVAASTSACSAPSGWVANNNDCDDTEPAVNPGAREYCNAVDDDCDALVDEDEALDAVPWYRDLDGDRFGDAANVLAACAAPAGYVADNDDCNDFNVAINPDGVESCNGLDDDCDGTRDEDTPCFDDDRDGYTELAGDCDDANPFTWPGAPELGDGLDNDCDGDIDEGTDGFDDDGDGFSEATGDCDDTDVLAYPGADEVCDGADNDCDLIVDEDDAVDAELWFLDDDGDGHGDAAELLVACDAPFAYVALDDDCDDRDPDVFPGQIETCNGVDDDCDGSADEALLSTFWRDADGDNFGDPAVTLAACGPTAGWVANDDDCDDGAASVSPTSPELCNLTDDDCDGSVDEAALDALTWWRDTDGDGFGLAGSTTTACALPGGYASNDDDCNDANNSAYPGAPETCDGVDQDCDLVADDGTVCFDDDRDGYTELDGDCDDANLYVFPGGTEFLDGLDNDCDGAVDDGTDGFDDDGDGFSEATGDCDDDDGAVFPGAVEQCNGGDDDCDSFVDEPDAIDAAVFWRDADGDLFGDPASSTFACTTPSGYVSNDDDCNDATSAVRPGATEVCNTIDDDCDGGVDEGVLPTWYADRDSDGYGDPAASAAACAAPASYVANDDDCDDTRGAAFPGADELCNDRDDDCDLNVDEGALDALDWYPDGDGDGFGRTVSPLAACDAPTGYAAYDGDCNDADPAIKPGAAEVCDGVDQNCDGSADEGVTVRYYRDLDLDTYGDTLTFVDACAAPGGYVVNGDDCDDTDASINPLTRWYLDADADGYGLGGAANTKIQCVAPAGSYARERDDCDDADATAYPGAPEVCDGDDEDCDGTDDESGASGCIDYYKDVDNDGFGNEDLAARCLCAADGDFDATVGGDCADNDGLAFPGATGWYTFASGAGDYDYNCDGTSERKFVSQFECTALAVTCTHDQSGWTGAIPNCGGSGTWADDCKLTAIGGTCTGDDTYTRAQECR
jgi:hypothetical protein